jgi:mycothiol synthase
MAVMLPLPENFVARPAKMGDAEAVVNVLNACSIEQIGKPQFRTDEMCTDWQRPGFSLEADTLVVLIPQGKLVGYTAVWDFEPHVRTLVVASVHPEHRGLGVGTALCLWAEERGRRSIPQAPAGARVALWQEKPGTDEVALALLRAQGYQFARYSLHMLIEMDDPPAPVVPDGFTVRPFIRGQEERAMIHAMRESFRGHWGYVERPFEEDLQDYVHLLDNPDNDPSLWFVVVDDIEEEIVGTSFCYPAMAEDPELGWIWGLGVRRPWRRRGLALALLKHCFGALYRYGKRKVGLDMDAQNLSAVRLYEKAGMHVERQCVVYEKELRPGAELGALSPEDQA